MEIRSLSFAVCIKGDLRRVSAAVYSECASVDTVGNTDVVYTESSSFRFQLSGHAANRDTPYETRPWPERVEHPFGTISVSLVSGGIARVSDSLTFSLVRIAGVRSCIANGVPRGASVRWHSSRGFWPVECQMTPHAARLIASVIVSGIGAKEIDARRAVPWHCHREHNRSRSLNASGSTSIPRRILSSTGWQ